MISFNEIGIDKKILKAIGELGFENPTLIQEKVIKRLIMEEKRDVIALAQTGTGKTAAFGLPIIKNIRPKENTAQCIILSPTRELCLQIANDFESFAKYMPEIKIVPIFGGAGIDNQIKKLKNGAHIISATPGRLIDLINRRAVNLKNINTVVLDEADEMLNMGFREDLEFILSETPSDKRTLLFSATMRKDVEKIASRYLKNPVEITVGRKNEGAENVEHYCYLVNSKNRYLALKRIVDYYPEIYGIIFCRTRKETQEVADLLIKDGYNAESLHGDLSQVQRGIVMNKFRIKHIRLLVATDVAARGLDVDNISHIINYNLPEELDIYTHRSGRTGRAGKKGISIVIAGGKEKSRLKQIENQLNKEFEFLPIPLGKEICQKQLIHLINRVENAEVEHEQINPLLPDIFEKLRIFNKEEIIKKFVSLEFNRFLEYYKNSSDLNLINEKERGDKTRKGNYNFSRLFINIGRIDDLRPNSLMKLISKETGIKNIELGKIEILKNFSFFETDSNFAEEIIKNLQGKTFGKREINIEIASSNKNSGMKKKKPQNDYLKGIKKDRQKNKSGKKGKSKKK